ncbi:MAG: metalloregulator ArsR/SmtB family transcription factor [Acidobacteriota bacterium]
MKKDATSARSDGEIVPGTPCACPPPATVAATGDSGDADLARLCKALAHPARVQILRLLASRATCICGELVGELELAQSTVSQHLKILKDAGLVRGEVQGPRTCYCLEPAVLAHLGRLVDQLVDAGAPRPALETPDQPKESDAP